MQGSVEISTNEPKQTNVVVVMPEWLEEKLLQELRQLYAYSVEQAAKVPEQGLKALENGMREKMASLGGPIMQVGLERGLGRGYQGSRMRCFGCGGWRRYVEDRDKIVTTWFKEIRVGRAYYHCEHCQDGIAPLDSMLGISGSSVSPAVREAICLADAIAI
ncbi:MAG: hypothetical protein HY549_09935 [Elusimicrobia bacterium]|nr:hypothetical protein [Elusimicrobiota bacterium]